MIGLRLYGISFLATMLLAIGGAGPQNSADPSNLLAAQPTGSSNDASESGFAIEGAITGNLHSILKHDATDDGVALHSAPRGGQPASGSISTEVAIDPTQGRWYQFRFRGLPQDGFAVADNGLFMQVGFLGGDDGKTAYDGKRKELYPLIQQTRRDLGVNGNLHVGGTASWRDYGLDFFIPFPQVNRLKLTIGFADGHGTPAQPQAQGQQPRSFMRPRGPGIPPVHLDTAGDAFLVTDWQLSPITSPAEMLQSASATTQPADPQFSLANLIPLGGRWFYDPKEGESAPPKVFDHTNVDRLLYHDGPAGGYEAPFAGNTSAYLRKGDKDEFGNIATADTFIADNVTIRFDSQSLIIHTHGLPNHPTGQFPENNNGRPGNPNYITEQENTYYLPLNPKINPSHIATDLHDSNRALNMGPIGIAVNGVVFFNPFDAGMIDASSAMDRCCGHPNQDGLYHYHKYPICVNSPWADEGKAHSPLIGFAFDGLPIYGPYESKDVMAKDLVGSNALNAFNIHFDAQRGWHYHVTPGKFPYIIGGYWATADRRDLHGPHGPPMAGQGRWNQGGPPDGGPDMGDFPPPPPF